MPSAKPSTRSENASESQSNLQTRPYSSANDRVLSQPTGNLGRRKGLSKSMSSLVIEPKKV